MVGEMRVANLTQRCAGPDKRSSLGIDQPNRSHEVISLPSGRTLSISSRTKEVVTRPLIRLLRAWDVLIAERRVRFSTSLGDYVADVAGIG